MTIPNKVIKTLYHEYIRRSLEEHFHINLDTSFLLQEFKNMAFRGQWKPLFQYILDKLYETASLGDFIDRESGVKMFLLSYLGLTLLYISKSEPEMNKSYADIFLRKDFVITDKTAHEYLAELKYVPARELSPEGKLSSVKLAALTEQAAVQLENYGAFRKISCSATKIVIMFSARGVILLDEA